MEEQNKKKKNHWTQTRTDNAIKKINQEIYKRKKTNRKLRQEEKKAMIMC